MDIPNGDISPLVVALSKAEGHEERLGLAAAIQDACWEIRDWAEAVTFYDRAATKATQMVVFIADWDFDAGHVGDRIQYEIWDRRFDVARFDEAISEIEAELKTRVKRWGRDCSWASIRRRQQDWIYKTNVVAYIQFRREDGSTALEI